jgi:glyoxylase-like metal-dependent hydrolase (beta-lactamase superfamily II)
MPAIRIHDVRGRFPVLPSHVHAYVVETQEAVVVVDATAAISSAAQLRAEAEATGKPLRAVVLTHGHPDHFTGLVRFQDVPVWASQGCADFARREDASKWRSGKQYLGDDFPDRRAFPDRIAGDGQAIDAGDVRLGFSDLGPGESDADGMWTVVADDAVHHFVGDVAYGGVHAYFGDGHVQQWIEVLDRLTRTCGPQSRFYLGHGDSPVGPDGLRRQRAYLERFLEVVAALPPESPVSQATQDRVAAAMREELPTDDFLFLLTYQLDQGIARTWESLGVRVS